MPTQLAPTVLVESIRGEIIRAVQRFWAQAPPRTPYAFALIGAQCRDGLSYAIASEQGLAQVAADYERAGYRYAGAEFPFDNREKLAAWLRWENPDDGWEYGRFPAESAMHHLLVDFHATGAFEEAPHAFEEFCTNVLTSLQDDRSWAVLGVDLVVGFTWGEDPRDFVRTATRASSYTRVSSLWRDLFAADELDRHIARPA